MTTEQLHVAEAALSAQDPILGGIIAQQDIDIRPRNKHYFRSLCTSTINQQISVAAAATICARFEAKTSFDPVVVQALSVDDIKSVGLSRQKATYTQDIAQHFLADPDVYGHLDSLDNDDVIAELTKIRGIGVWTAQMFLMNSLGRRDVFAPDDVGLQKGMMALYDWETLPPKKDLVAAAEKWAPYRTVASWHVWQLANSLKKP